MNDISSNWPFIKCCKTRPYSIIILLLVSLSCFAFKNEEIILSAKHKVSKDLVYKTVDEQPLKLDLYTPAARNGKPANLVIYIHGGGWTSGDKSIISAAYRKALLDSLLIHGYAVASINYRLLNAETHLPTSIIDCKDAIRWLRTNAVKYNINPDNIGLWGSSAGGHLALLCAYTSEEQFSDSSQTPDVSSKVDYVIDNFGPTDLNKLLHTGLSKIPEEANTIPEEAMKKHQSVLSVICGSEILNYKERAIESCKQYSPMTYLGAHCPPTLILHGNADKIVPLSQSEELDRKLAEYGVVHQLMVYPGVGHAFPKISQKLIAEMAHTCVTFVEARYKE